MTRHVPDFWDVAAVAASFDALRQAPPVGSPAPAKAPCRCGWPTSDPDAPIVSLAGTFGRVRLETNPTRRRCRACRHAIHHDQPAVVHEHAGTGRIYDRYHPECVEMT